MNRRNFLKTIGSGAAALALPGGLYASQQKSSKLNSPPNIIFIMADDMGYGDVGCYNPDSKIPTPNMDRLARQGVRFTDAHSPSAVCSPTRYGVLTGRYCWRTWLKRGALIGFNPPLIEPGRMTVASLLKQHRYHTACIGKWHIGFNWQVKPGQQVDFRRPLDWPMDYIIEVSKKIDYSKPIEQGPVTHGFDYFFGTAGCSTTDPPYVFIENDRTLGIPSMMRTDDMQCDPGLMVPGWKQQDADTTFTKKAVTFMENHQKNKPRQPIFLYLSLSAPHAPHLPPDFVKGRSQTGPRGDMVAWVDWSVGQILDALDRLKLVGNTLLIVTSDNGPLEGRRGHESAGNLRGLKASIWEGGHRIPFIARWPGHIKPDSTSGEVICLTDLMATCATLVGAELPPDAGEDSFNILPALLGRKLEQPIRPATIHHSGGGDFAIRQGSWKLIPDSPNRLFNLADDPSEKNNIYQNHPDITQRLTKLLQKYQTKGRSRPL